MCPLKQGFNLFTSTDCWLNYLTSTLACHTTNKVQKFSHTATDCAVKISMQLEHVCRQKTKHYALFTQTMHRSTVCICSPSDLFYLQNDLHKKKTKKVINYRSYSLINKWFLVQFQTTVCTLKGRHFSKTRTECEER